MYDFFVSYNQADKEWAEWIASELEEASYKVIIQAWDFRPGSNFVLDMQRSAEQAERTIAVLSPDYLGAEYTQPEWAAAFVQDPTGARGIFVPVRVRECEIKGLLQAVVYIDLVGRDKEAARQVLLEGVERARRKPSTAALFPGRPAPAKSYVPAEPPPSGTLPSPGPLPPGSRLPHVRNVHFSGREGALMRLGRQLLPQGTGSPTSPASDTRMLILTGMGGIGKTLLAVEFAHRYGGCFHGVHWVDCTQPDLIPAEITACGAEMDLSPWPDKQPQQVKRTLDAWCQEDGTRLVILDNLEDVPALRQWLPRLLQGRLRLLATSRRADWPGDLGLSVTPLAVFRPEESQRLLRHHVPSERASDQELDVLAERLGHLPLALQLAGRYLFRLPGLPVPAFLAKLSGVFQHRAFRNWRADLGDPVGHELDLSATFYQSWQQVIDEDAKRLLLVAGYCAPNQPVPCEVLEGAAKFDADVCGEGLAFLTGLGLLSLEDPAAGPVIHPLLAEYARGLSPSLAPHRAGGGSEPAPRVPSQGVGCEWHPLLSLVETLAELAWEANDTGVPSWFAALRPHVESAAVAAEEFGLEQTGSLWTALAEHRLVISDHDGALAAVEKARVIDEGLFGPEDPRIARDLTTLSRVMLEMGNTEGAQDEIANALRIDEEALGPEHPDVARDLDQLATVLFVRGEYQEARVAVGRALAIDESSVGPEHPFVARDLNSMGRILGMLGDYDEARQAYERSLNIRRTTYGEDHPLVAVCLMNLAGVLYRLGDHQGALSHMERTLELFQRHLGPNHPRVGMVHGNIGVVQQTLGNLPAAQSGYERALASISQAYGPEHSLVGHGYISLGSLLKARAEYPEARFAFEQALSIFERSLEPDHAYNAVGMRNLASVLEELGDLEGAEAGLERALEIEEACYGRQHQNIGYSLRGRARIRRAQGDLAGARAAVDEAIAIHEATLGGEHYLVAADLVVLGQVLRDLGELENAQTAIERALTIEEAALGSESIGTARALSIKGTILLASGELTAARAATERALEISEAARGSDHPDVARDLANLGDVLREQGDAAGAETVWRRALAILDGLLPPHHPRIEELHESLAGVTSEDSRLPSSLP